LNYLVLDQKSSWKVHHLGSGRKSSNWNPWFQWIRILMKYPFWPHIPFSKEINGPSRGRHDLLHFNISSRVEKATFSFDKWSQISFPF
jgi:hypothetical protein